MRLTVLWGSLRVGCQLELLYVGTGFPDGAGCRGSVSVCFLTAHIIHVGGAD